MFITNFVDAEIMKEIHDNSFPLPDLLNPLYVSQKTAIENGRVVAIGLVRLTAEGVLICNMKEGSLARARASATLIEELKKDCIQSKLDECHVFVKDSKVHKFLSHLGFKFCQGGTPMVIHF
jgi:hypothetical protein